jgi:hypothetical protein
MSGAILLLPICAFMAWTWKTLPFSLCCIHTGTYVTYLTSLALYGTLKNVWTVNKCYSILLYYIILYYILFCCILFYSILFYSILFYSILFYCNQSNCCCWTQLTGYADFMSIMFTSRNYIGELGIVNVKIILKWIIIVSSMF